MKNYSDRYKSYCVKFEHDDWDELNLRYEQLTEHLGIKVSKHKFIKSCIAAGIKAIAHEMDDFNEK